MNKKVRLLFVTVIALIMVACVMLLSSCRKPVDKCDNIADISDCDYKISAVLHPDNLTVDCSVGISFKYSGGVADSIELLMNANVFTSSTPVEPNEFKVSYPKGDSYGIVNIAEVTYNDKAAEYAMENNSLTLTPAGKKIKSGRNEINIKYSLKLPYTRLRYGANQYSMQLANFYPQIARVNEYYPIGDPFYSNVADYDVTITHPKGYKLIASGDLLDSAASNELITSKYSAENIRDYAIVLGINGEILTATTQKGYVVNYYYNLDLKSEKSLKIACAAVDTFSDLFGEYHHKTLNVVEVDFAQGGMEFGGLVYINLDKNAASKERVIIHEIAHQWWYGNVGSDQVAHAWQDEGLTEFSVELFYRHNDMVNQANAYKNMAKMSLKSYIDYVGSIGIACDDRIDRSLDDFTNSMEYVYNVYDKGYLMFESVYTILGENIFMKSIRDYYRNNLFRLAQPQDLYDAFNKNHGGSELLYKSWLKGNVIASY